MEETKDDEGNKKFIAHPADDPPEGELIEQLLRNDGDWLPTEDRERVTEAHNENTSEIFISLP